MSTCCSTFCAAARGQFDAAVAEGDLRRYERKGPNPTTRLLRDAILAAGGGQTLLDVGAGIGALSLELLRGGFDSAILVEAASAYLETGRRAAAARGQDLRMEFCEGDFVSEAPQLPTADAVVMDRVVCCYPAYQPLLEAALSHSRRLFAWSYPHDRWYVRLVVRIQNVIRALAHRAFRTYVHPERAMRDLFDRCGFRRVAASGTLVWSVEVYARQYPTGVER